MRKNIMEKENKNETMKEREERLEQESIKNRSYSFLSLQQDMLTNIYETLIKEGYIKEYKIDELRNSLKSLEKIKNKYK